MKRKHYDCSIHIIKAKKKEKKITIKRLDKRCMRTFTNNLLKNEAFQTR